ncbi:Protein of unknown function [Anaerosphaera aminiphila DSM 21120]|uniref:DUF2848 domain-containing protein n=1 Tax=Anaerosphaera aminiphila DSM 21120 TaxID=1120995 RepID=A0A1M5R4Y2_9FIRM|nr:DUF2848 family protein [Anaerosphaera aminiphila]SHH21261.1 Protein of unknown function [Anaerosphaera aminiphila DSM 21120]
MELKNFNLDSEVIEFGYDKVYIIGYAGRDIKKTQEHIDELERELGVKPPKKIPTIFECSKELVTQNIDLKFVDDMTSGECEYVILKKNNSIYIALGSDHTDRKLESVSVPKSKQVCLKPISKDVWNYDHIKDHWDEIELRSYVTIDDKEIEYQAGTLKDILPVETILSELENRIGNVDNAIIFSGTVPLKNNFVYGSRFRSEMIDKKLNKKIDLNYKISVISEEER